MGRVCVCCFEIYTNKWPRARRMRMLESYSNNVFLIRERGATENGRQQQCSVIIRWSIKIQVVMVGASGGRGGAAALIFEMPNNRCVWI